MNVYKSCNSLSPLIPSFVLSFPFTLFFHALKDTQYNVIFVSNSHLPFKEIKIRKMLIFYFGTNYSCLSSSFLYVDQFPTSVIFFYLEKIPLVFLWYRFVDNPSFNFHSSENVFILFLLSWDVFSGHNNSRWTILPSVPSPLPQIPVL